MMTLVLYDVIIEGDVLCVLCVLLYDLISNVLNFSYNIINNKYI